MISICTTGLWTVFVADRQSLEELRRKLDGRADGCEHRISSRRHVEFGEQRNVLNGLTAKMNYQAANLGLLAFRVGFRDDQHK